MNYTKLLKKIFRVSQCGKQGELRNTNVTKLCRSFPNRTQGNTYTVSVLCTSKSQKYHNFYKYIGALHHVFIATE